MAFLAAIAMEVQLCTEDRRKVCQSRSSLCRWFSCKIEENPVLLLVLEYEHEDGDEEEEGQDSSV